MADLALIETKTGEVVSTFPEGEQWVDLPGVGQMSPPYDGWEGGGYAIKEITPAAEVPDDKIVASTEVVYEKGEAREEVILADKPAPLSNTQKLETSVGLTVDEIKAVLGIGGK